jgi:hypothetical protein
MEAIMPKTERISARVEPEILAIVQRVAESERRPVASVVRNVVTDWALQQRAVAGGETFA